MNNEDAEVIKKQKQDIKRLKKEKKYEEIFHKYGQYRYIKSASKEYKKQDLDKLFREGKFEDIYLRYGEETYNEFLNKFKQREIEQQYGKKSVKAIFHKISYKIKAALGITIYSVGSFGVQMSMPLVINTVIESEMVTHDNSKEYEGLIKQYENEMNQYAEKINNMNLTDMEIFMKVQNDMHKSIIGYGNPRLDINGYLGLDMRQDNAIGVCRNMADHISKTLNAINPQYNARMFAVRTKSGEFEKANIQTNNTGEFIFSEDKLSNTLMRRFIEQIRIITKNEDVANMLGNHAVVAVDLKEENLTLIIDPTNICLGVFKNGEITIFNSLDEQNSYDMDRTPLDEISYRGLEAMEVPYEYVKSFLNPFSSIEMLEEKFGIEAQNNALESAEIKEQNYIYEMSKEEKFKDRLKVNTKENEIIYSVEEIENQYKQLKESVLEMNQSQEIIEAGNIYRKIVYSLDYYNKKQKEIIGRNINYEESFSSKMNLDLIQLKEEICDKLVETNSFILPEDSGGRTLLSIAYLQAGTKEKLEELRVTYNEENCYYILNDSGNLLSTVNIFYEEEKMVGGTIYQEKEEDVNKHSSILFKKSKHIIQTQKEIPNVLSEKQEQR